MQLVCEMLLPLPIIIIIITVVVVVVAPTRIIHTEGGGEDSSQGKWSGADHFHQCIIGGHFKYVE